MRKTVSFNGAFTIRTYICTIYLQLLSIHSMTTRSLFFSEQKMLFGRKRCKFLHASTSTYLSVINKAVRCKEENTQSSLANGGSLKEDWFLWTAHFTRDVNSAKAYVRSTNHSKTAKEVAVFLRERGCKCKALQSQLEHLCILQTLLGGTWWYSMSVLIWNPPESSWILFILLQPSNVI